MYAAVIGLTILAMGTPSVPALDQNEFTVIFDGSSAENWMLSNGQPVPSKNIQPDGLNPYQTGAYLIVYKEPVQNFVLDFEYKLTPSCNSGVFFRVGDLRNPVYTGLEVAIDDSQGTGNHDSGAIYDLTTLKLNAQKPAGEWNHMILKAEGAKVSVTLNDEVVTTMDMDQFDKAGTRPDGSSHKFREVVVKDLNRKGYFGFQDHGKDCWYRNVKLQILD